MLKIKPPDYKYCPFCSKKLSARTEEGKKLKHCTNCRWRYYPHANTAVAAIIKKDKMVLLVKRSRNPYKGTWMLPAGFVDFGEHPDETLVREVKEETGLDVKNFKLFQIEQSTDDPRAPGHFIFEYFVKASGKIKNLDNEENSNIGWFEIKNPPKIGWQQHEEIIKLLQSKV